jgi:hypothetical protein
VADEELVAEDELVAEEELVGCVDRDELDALLELMADELVARVDLDELALLEALLEEVGRALEVGFEEEVDSEAETTSEEEQAELACWLNQEYMVNLGLSSFGSSLGLKGILALDWLALREAEGVGVGLDTTGLMTSDVEKVPSDSVDKE